MLRKPGLVKVQGSNLLRFEVSHADAEGCFDLCVIICAFSGEGISRSFRIVLRDRGLIFEAGALKYRFRFDPSLGWLCSSEEWEQWEQEKKIAFLFFSSAFNLAWSYWGLNDSDPIRKEFSQWPEQALCKDNPLLYSFLSLRRMERAEVSLPLAPKGFLYCRKHLLTITMEEIFSSKWWRR